MSSNSIIIRGARVHNLKNVSLDIPRDKLVVITGISGSGKSSLAFDTIYAEGQRRYVESLSAYARQFLGLMDKPDVDQIDGLSPAISIDQKSVSHNPRSTVGTVTEIYDYLRLLYARVGIPHCPKCGKVIEKQTVDQIVKNIVKTNGYSSAHNAKIALLAPVIRDQKGEHKNTLMRAQKEGFANVRFDGLFTSIDEILDSKIDKQKKHTVDIVVDRMRVPDANDKDELSRLHQSVESALDLGDGLIIIHSYESEVDYIYSQHFSCPDCDINLPEIEPRSFSFNSPHGACQVCTGLGVKQEIDPDLAIPNKKLSISEGAIRPWSRTTGAGISWYLYTIDNISGNYNFSIHTPIKDLTKRQLDIILYGSPSDDYEGVIPNLMRRWKETESEYIRTEIEKYMRARPCPSCKGKRLLPEALAVTVAGKSIDEVVGMTIEEARKFFLCLSQPQRRYSRTTKSTSIPGGEFQILSVRQQKIAKQILKEINNRLSFLHNVGLDYLMLDRGANTLSGGEAQRIRLATQIGSSLVGVLYVLDEPSIGLHQRDNKKLINTLKTLRDLGNTVIVVEHDKETILSADYIVDIGPGAGAHGGEIVAQGTSAQIKKQKKSLTGQYLSGSKSIPAPNKYRKGNGKYLKIIKAEEFNLKKINVDIPLGCFVCITGVSGSGKSTLMTEVLAKSLLQHFYRSKNIPGKHKEIKGIEYLDKVINIDQSPIGRTPRSNPATYTGLFTPIRELFSNVPEARIRGYKPGRFSFNVKGGRCETCQGDGLVRIEMNFLPDVYVDCEECHGKRYNREALEIHYKDKNIADILEMTVEEAVSFFESIPSIHAKLKTLYDVGLSYIHLGQPATTLSGGEAQRVKLSTELSRRATGKTLYILDEPTTGLHFDDVKRLLHVLNQLVEKGNTVLIIEHNMDVIKSADWIIDLGPEGGNAGGEIVAQGTPRDVAKVKKSYTGQFLRKVLS